MPTVNSTGNPLVLVSGANGYIATWVVQALLEQGYAVRGTVRSEEKGKHLSEYFDSTPYSSRFEWIVVNDIAKHGAFDEAVKGVDAIEHIASQNISFDRPNDEPDVFITPAVQGTLGILQSALEFGSKVKRIVITSSIVAILQIFTDPETTVLLDENSWGDDYVKIVQEQGKDSGLFEKYSASKNLAERAAWDFHQKHKSKVTWDLVSINPATLPLLDSSEGVPASLEYWYINMCKEQLDEALGGTYGYVDIQDVVAAHVEALKQEAAGGERFIVCAGTVTWQENRNLLFNQRPELYTSGALPRGNPSISNAVQYKYNTTKVQELLGFKYRDASKTFNDTVDYFETRDLLKPAEGK
ncbi:hypothetical protein CVT25_007529 [Psilocybe cyanescens]|uniref:NAD-dependent epimerase/dehydratase domain-containing protein n=1 Tax=Psilocybe cyanescens TaxID=93625 RepID=A0A409XGB6_PSICY|nr:hypothetical protein CVT25_007529 [Psilocybe cyanescens]